MENLIESQNYSLTTEEELFYINDINYLLTHFKNQLPEADSKTILDASIICEYMLNLLLKKEGYLFKNNAQFKDIIDLASNKKLIPQECINFLNTIIIYKNNVNKDITTKKLISAFLNAFRYYITWFNKSYSNKNQFNIKDICDKINLLYPQYETTYKFYSTADNIKEEISVDYDLSKINITNTDFILDALDQQNETLKIILETVLKTLEITKNIDAKLDEINNNLNRVQSQTEKLIKTAWSEDEIDRIIQVHTDECVEKILEYKNDILQDKQFELEEKTLIDTFGDNTWNKLSDDSKTFLITSKFMYHKLLMINEDLDYSGICVLVTKALETEIFKRFFTNFIRYLDEKYDKDYSKYHSALLFQNTEPLYPERFTMGNIAFVLCYKENRFDTKEQRKINKLRLMEYCQSCVFSQYEYVQIVDFLNSYASSIEEIRIKYRNPSAHRGQIKRVDAKECFDLVIDVEKLLKKMLDTFDS